MTRKDYKYDAALSFAGENRDYARRLAESLKAHGARVFYDGDYRAHLWGQRQAEFERIYGPETRYVVPLISKHYVDKDWTRFELAIAKREAKRRKCPFILPIRIDDSLLLGLPDDVMYLHATQDSIKVITESLLAKLRPSSGADGTSRILRTPRGGRDPRPAVLSRSARRVLGLIAACTLPMPLAALEQIFPRLEWRKETQYLKQRKFLVKLDGIVSASKSVRRALLADTEEARDLHQAWVDALRPLEKHVDVAMMLSLHYIGLGGLDEALSVLADVVESMTLGWWNAPYLSALGALAKKHVVARIKPDTRFRLYNAMGICLSHDDRHDEAIKWYMRLRRCSLRAGNNWWLGQSYINCGVAYFNGKKSKQAESCYHKAIEHARKTHDNILLGRSLSNLAQIVEPRSLQQAQRLFQESLRIKRRAKDESGLVASYIAIAHLSVVGGNPSDAVVWYQRAEGKARTLGLRYELCMAQLNMGSAYFDSGEPEKALSLYRKAYRLAEEDGYCDLLALACSGEARAFFETGDFVRAERQFLELRGMKRSMGEAEDELEALHDAGASALRQRKLMQARKNLGGAIRLARRIGATAWIGQCIIDRSLTYDGGKLGRRAISILKRNAREESRLANHTVAARIWEVCATSLRFMRCAPTDVAEALEHCLACLKAYDGNCADRARVLGNLYCVRWEQGDYVGGFQALGEMAKISAKGHLVKEQFQAVNQKGVCLQELGRPADALPLHEMALRLARRLGDCGCLQMALNNLGESLRKTEKHGRAVLMLRKAEQLALKHRDHEGMVMVVHNRALALQDAGHCSEAEKMLQRCLSLARQSRLDAEYVRALEGLANLSARRGQRATARRRYANALKEAKRLGLRERQAEIALNYAVLLGSEGNAKQAIRVMKSHEPTFCRRLDSHIYFRILSDLHADVRDNQAAMAFLRKAKQAARKTGHESQASEYDSALTQMRDEQRQSALLERRIVLVLRRERRPKTRAALLTKRLGVLMDANKKGLAERAFAEARSLTLEHHLAEERIDLHVEFGDHAWGTDNRSTLNALKCYAVAMLEALAFSTGKFAHVMTHIVERLLSTLLTTQTIDFDSMQPRLTRWLYKQAGGSEDIMTIGSWPLRLARRLSGVPMEPSKIENAIKKILHEETARLLPRQRGQSLRF